MTRHRQFLVLPVLSVFGALMIAGCSVHVFVPTPLPAPEEPEPLSIEELKARVDKLLASGDSVIIRRDVDGIFELVDRLTETGREDEALPYLSSALKHNSWALDYQLLNARLLKSRGEAEVPRQTAELVLQYAEQGEQIDAARQLLDLEPLAPVRSMGQVNSEAITVVLVPIGEPDTCVLEDLRSRLAEYLGTTILLEDAAVSVPKWKRDPVEQALADMRERLRQGIRQDPHAKALLGQDGIAVADLEQDQKVVDAYRRLVFASAGEDALSEFDAGMSRLRESEKQWDICDVRDSLREAVKPFIRNHTYFLGLTDLDVFTGEYNFLFYIADSPGHCAVTSYRRFTADFNQETPDRTRLVERTLKSSLACIGFMLGVPRCSTPACPRTYPHNLQELDAASVRLCDECRRGFQGVLPGLPDDNSVGVDDRT